jgi:hypothetical protein
MKGMTNKKHAEPRCDRKTRVSLLSKVAQPSSWPLRPSAPIKAILSLVASVITACFLWISTAVADISHGDAENAKRYYRTLAAALEFSAPDQIFETKLDDVAAYLGYGGIRGEDLQILPPSVLMNPDQLLAPCTTPDCSNSLRDRNAVLASLGPVPIRPDDILVSRFFAPKIMNIKEPEATRKLGWRKLVRLRARAGSKAEAHKITAGIILFNIFTDPGKVPFGPEDESVNTQVMLLTDLAAVQSPGRVGPPTVYWLDYDKISNGGRLSLALHASFDANELPASSDGARDYFVPDGCIACHGNNSRRSMVNYLDTDHWFDRLATDFPNLKAQGLPLLFDAQTNDPSSVQFKLAFDVIRRFNIEADLQAKKAQPKHDEVLAAQKWIDIHATANDLVPPLDRAIGSRPHWSADTPGDAEALGAMNQYCFRCHGTIKFSVFNKQAVRERRANLRERLSAEAPVGVRMPPDRELPEDVRSLLLQFSK